MDCPRCDGEALPVQPVEVDGEPGVELACSNCGSFRRRQSDL